jgi:virulence-associated protein VapD
MYAIAFDMDIESLKIHYGDPYNIHTGNSCIT